MNGVKINLVIENCGEYFELLINGEKHLVTTWDGMLDVICTALTNKKIDSDNSAEISQHDMDKKIYLIDSEPASARDVINLASQYDDDFAKEFIKQSSVAANILRKNQHTVEER